MTDTLLFWALAGTAAASALAVVVFRNPVNGVMALLVNLLATAGLYLLMGAPGIALFQVILYVGAVLVLFLFAVMVLDWKTGGPPLVVPLKPLTAGAAAVVLAGGGAAFLAGNRLFPRTGLSEGPPGPGPGIREIALDLFTRHLLVFELASVLLLAAAVGAVLIVRKERKRS